MNLSALVRGRTPRQANADSSAFTVAESCRLRGTEERKQRLQASRPSLSTAHIAFITPAPTLIPSRKHLPRSPVERHMLERHMSTLVLNLVLALAVGIAETPAMPGDP